MNEYGIFFIINKPFFQEVFYKHVMLSVPAGIKLILAETPLFADMAHYVQAEM